MLEMKILDCVYVNTKTTKHTTVDDPDALEFVHFYLKG